MSLPIRLMASEDNPESPEIALRPQRLTEFVGQAQARQNLSVFIEAAQTRREAMDHVLFYGPPGRHWEGRRFGSIVDQSSTLRRFIYR